MTERHETPHRSPLHPGLVPEPVDHPFHQANKVLSHPGPFMPRRGGGETVNKAFLKVSGDELSGLMLDRPGAITTIRAKVDNLPPSPDDQTALRERILQIR